MATDIEQLVSSFRKKTRKAFRFLERDYEYQYLGVKQSGLEYYPRDGQVGMRYANAAARVGVEVEFGVDYQVDVCLIKLKRRRFPDEYSVFGHRDSAQGIDLQSFVEYSTGSEIDTILSPRSTWHLTANKSTRLTKKRRELIGSKLDAILAELSNLLAEHGESVLRGDTSSFAKVQKYHCKVMGCRLTDNGTWLDTMVSGEWRS